MACEYLNQFSTAQVLIENYYLKNYNSIFVKDQVQLNLQYTFFSLNNNNNNDKLIIPFNKDNYNSGEHGFVRNL